MAAAMQNAMMKIDAIMPPNGERTRRNGWLLFE
jgi:hypothetical protein